MHRCATGQAGRGSPQGIVGRRQKQLVTVVQQAIGGHDDQFTGPVAQVNILQRHALDALLLGLVHHGLASTKNTFAVGVPRRVGQVTNHVLLDFFRRIETKHSQIANVQANDFLPLFFHLARAVHDGASDVIADIGKFGGF